MMLIQVLITVLTLSLLGALLIALQHDIHKLKNSDRRANWKKYSVYLVYIAVFVSIINIGKYALALFFILISLAGAFEYFRKQKGLIASRILRSVLLLVIVLVFLEHLVIVKCTDWCRHAILTLLIVGITDSFAQLWGKLLGRHKLCRCLSPEKTIEGMTGGIATAVFSVPLLSFLMPDLPLYQLLIFTLIISVSAVIGDLSFSYIKRRLQIKDFSNAIPGHGGLLDRFDSLIAAAPVAYWTMYFLVK